MILTGCKCPDQRASRSRADHRMHDPRSRPCIYCSHSQRPCRKSQQPAFSSCNRPKQQWPNSAAIVLHWQGSPDGSSISLGLVTQDPSVYSHSQQVKRSDLRLLAHTSGLFLECKDPVQLLVSLSGGPTLPTASALASTRYIVTVMSKRASNS